MLGQGQKTSSTQQGLDLRTRLEETAMLIRMAMIKIRDQGGVQDKMS